MGTQVLGAFDIIGDIHGHGDELIALLHKMGYQWSGLCYRHPERQAVFLGDFIDRGPQQRDVLNIVKPMVEYRAAYAVMGNHEFNALAFHTPHPQREGEWLRPRTEKNIHQHRAFLNAYRGPDHQRELDAMLDWFMTLPLWLEFPGLRVVHACWHDAYMAQLYPHLSSQQTLTPSLLVAANTKGSATFEAVDILLKGWEIDLPNGGHFVDHDGHRRNKVRTRWWLNDRASYQLAALPPGIVNRTERIDAGMLPGYADHQRPVFVGHYWWDGYPRPLVKNVACVDYSVAKAGKLVAYRWDGEQQLAAKKFVWVTAGCGSSPLSEMSC